MTANTTNVDTNVLTTDFNISPYYDDYDPQSEYYKILFKPGYAVQARELTQIQSILQRQISRFGDHVFKEGSIVIPGTYTLKANPGDLKGQPIDYVKIKNVDVSNNTININDYDGATFIGATSNISAYVNQVLDTDGTTANTKTLYVTYLNASTSNSQIRKFIAGETLTSNVGTAIVLNNDPVANTGYAASFEIDEGVFFAKGLFVRFPDQKVILSRYDANPTCKVGFFVDEQIVNYSSDSSLLDPALESSNYSAPGADRLKIASTLEVVDYDYNDSENFVTLFTIKNGVLQKTYEKTQYNILGDSLADRTYDESGNYVVTGMNTQISEHDRVTTPVNNNGRFANGNNQLLVVTVDPGEAYVKGYPVSLRDRNDIEIPKPLDFRNVSTQVSSTTMGGYLPVNELVGAWQLDQGNRIYFYDKVQRRISNTAWSIGSPTGNVIGSAIYNTLEYSSGTPGYDAIYNLYLSDIQMNGTNSFATVRGMYYNYASVADNFADVFGSDNTTSNTSLQELNKSPLLYFVGSNYTKTARDTSGNPSMIYYFNRTDGISSALSLSTNGTFTLAYSGPANQYFPYGSTTLTDNDVLQDIKLSLGASFNIGPLFSAATVTGYGNTRLIGAGTFFTRFNVGDKIELSGQANTFYIASISSNTEMFLTSNTHPSVTGNTIFKAYKTGDQIDMSGKGIDSGTQRTITATPTTLAFDMKETLPSTAAVTVSYKLVSTSSAETLKVLNPNRVVKINCTSLGTTSGPFCLGFSDVYKINKVVRKTGSMPTSLTDGTDVTSYFTLDNGQRDTFYDLGYLNKAPVLSLSSTDCLLVDLDYFTQNFSSREGFYTKDSYPVQDDDTLSSNTTIRTENIPVYTSPVTSLKYDLRNQIDFRPVKAITAVDTTVVASATTNPANNSTTYNFSATGMKFPIPATEMIYDYSYYLGRKDIVVVNKDGNFGVVQGIPSEVPFAPEALETQMLLSILNIVPYPSLSPAYGNNLGRKDLACSAKKVSNRRYTMRDIGLLDNRISNLEYYAALTLLEKDALNLKVLDDAGLDRFKNGIFVDTFKDASLSAKGVDPDFRIVTDPVEFCIRPLFSTTSLGYDYISGSGVRVHDDGVVTLDYDEVLQYAQTRVTDARNLERGTFLFQGEMTLFPKEDIWVDTSYAPDELVSIESGSSLLEIDTNYDDDTAAQITRSLINTEWEGWKTTITGYNLYQGNGASRKFIGTYTTEAAARKAAAAWTTSENGGVATLETVYNNTRIGTNYFANQSTDTGAGGNKLISSEVIPYIRPQRIAVQCLGIKAYSKMNAFFDGVNVSDYCTPLTKAQFEKVIAGNAPWSLGQVGIPNEGDDLIVNNDGTLYFWLRIAEDGPKFRIGSRRITVIDGEQLAPESIASELDASTSAQREFYANGTRQVLQKTVYSTKGHSLSNEATSEQYKSTSQLVLPNTWVEPKTGHCCFDPDAKVLMADFTWKAIKDIQPGDRVVGNHGVVNTVSANKRIGVGIRKMIKLKGTSFYTTDDHLFLTKKGWKTWRPDIVLNSPETKNGEFLIGENRERSIDGDDFLKKINIVDGKMVEEFVPFNTLDPEVHDFESNYVVHDLTLDGNMTYIVEGYVVHNCCVAYTVLIRAPQDEEGIFVSSFDIFVARKSATRGLWFEIREVNNAGGVTTSQVPNSYVFVENADIPVSTDGKTNPLNVKFDSPVFMFNNKEYAFIVHSFSPSFNVDPDTQLWISRLGEIDKNTNAKVNDRQNAGVFYQTNNNKYWGEVKDIDLTINVYRAQFTPGTQSFVIGNKPIEKVILNNVTKSIAPKIGDYFTSGDKITLTGANGTIYTGNTIRGNISTTNANSVVISIPTAGQYLMANTGYRIGEKVDIYNGGTYAGVTATVSAVSNTNAKLSYYSETAATLYAEFEGSNGGLLANTRLRALTDASYSANVGYIKDFTYSAVSFEPKVLDFIKTDLVYDMKTVANTSNTLGGFEYSVHPSETYYFNEQKSVKSRTNEISNLSGSQSNQIRISLSSTSQYVSPVFDIDTSHSILIDNLVNANTSGETGKSGGSAVNKYISQTITLADGQEAEDLRVYLTSYRPPNTDVKVYVKLLQADDVETLQQKSWFELEKDGDGDGIYSSSSDRFNFKEYVYKIPASYMTGTNGEFRYTNGAGTTFTGYKYFAVKIVLTATNAAVVPRVADLRCIALQL
jgi:hypothetical protein